MAVVKINAIEVAPDRGAELEERFARRASELEKMPGFLGFESAREAPVAQASNLLEFEVVQEVVAAHPSA